MRIKQVLSIQSYVVYGYVGNKSAMFCLSQLGIEPLGVHTVQFSNHTGYESFSGDVMSYSHLSGVLGGIQKQGVFPNLDAVLSGYQGSAPLGELILETVEKVKLANSSAIYCCDPVIGDVGVGQFVKPSVASFIKAECVSMADILTPNLFELAYLTGYPLEELAEISVVCQACDELHQRGPKVILVTSLTTDNENTMQMLVSTPKEKHKITTDKFSLKWPVSGAGDATAALFLAHMLEKNDVKKALEQTTDSIFALFEVSAEMGERELQFLRARERMLHPLRSFKSVKLS